MRSHLAVESAANLSRLLLGFLQARSFGAADRLRDPHPGVEEQPQDGRVAPVGEVTALAGLQQPAQLVGLAIVQKQLSGAAA
jgi:hypothetical protein